MNNLSELIKDPQLLENIEKSSSSSSSSNVEKSAIYNEVSFRGLLKLIDEVKPEDTDLYGCSKFSLNSSWRNAIN